MQHRARSARSNLIERMIANKAYRAGLNVTAAADEKYLLTPGNKRLIDRPQTSKGYSGSNRTMTLNPNTHRSGQFRGANATEDYFTSERSTGLSERRAF
jgi:hypothetical protein